MTLNFLTPKGYGVSISHLIVPVYVYLDRGFGHHRGEVTTTEHDDRLRPMESLGRSEINEADVLFPGPDVPGRVEI